MYLSTIYAQHRDYQKQGNLTAEDTTLRKLVLRVAATARASNVLPRRQLGLRCKGKLTCARRAIQQDSFWRRDTDALLVSVVLHRINVQPTSNSSGFIRGSSMTSRSSRTWSPRPPIPAKDTDPGSSSDMLYTCNQLRIMNHPNQS